MHYCGKEHQKHDWKNHKDVCKLVLEVSKYPRSSDMTTGEMKAQMQLRLGGRLTRIPTATALKKGRQHVEAFLASNSAHHDMKRAEALEILALIELRLGNHVKSVERMKAWCNGKWFLRASIVPSTLEHLRVGHHNHDDGDIMIDYCACMADDQMLNYALCHLLHQLATLDALRAMKNASLLISKLPTRIVNLIKTEFATSTMLADCTLRRDIGRSRSLTTRMQALEEDVFRLIGEIDAANQCFWVLVQQPAMLLEHAAGIDHPCPFNSAFGAFIYTYDAFIEVPGAMDCISTGLRRILPKEEKIVMGIRRLMEGKATKSCSRCVDPDWF